MTATPTSHRGKMVNAFNPDADVKLPAGTRGLIERRAKLLGPAYRLFYRTPVHIVRGLGTKLWDDSGDEYLDAYNNVVSVGHANPHVVQAVSRQMETLCTHTRYLHDGILDYAEELRARNTQLQADFNMAREIQEIFIPQQYPTFPHAASPEKSALRFSHRYIPAAEVGGDFFTIFPITDSTAGVFICDVMGHGMRAALITAIMRGLLEELTPVAADAGKFLAEINRSLYAILKRTKEPFLATAFYMVADAVAGELRFSSAGHPSPYHLQRRAGIVEPLKCSDSRHGPALGLFERSNYPTCKKRLEAGDLLLLFTDGLYEATDGEGEEYGQDRLIEVVRRSLHHPTESLLHNMLSEVQQYSGTRDFDDDVCLVAMDVARVGEG